MEEDVIGCLLIIFLALLIILGPLATIAALNLLFGLTIPFTFWTWLSIVWVSFVIGGSKLDSSTK